MSERESNAPEQSLSADERFLDRLWKEEPGFLEEFADCVIFAFGEKVVGTYRREEMVATYSSDWQPIREAIRGDLASKGINMDDCAALLTYPIQTVTVSAKIPINPDNIP